MIICLPIRLLSGSSELLLTDYRYVFPMLCFVLAPNKDLAVSFSHFCETYPDGYRNLSVLAFLFAPRILLWTAVSSDALCDRSPAPFSVGTAIILSRKIRLRSLAGWCSDFPPPAFTRSNHAPCLPDLLIASL